MYVYTYLNIRFNQESTAT